MRPFPHLSKENDRVAGRGQRQKDNREIKSKPFERLLDFGAAHPTPTGFVARLNPTCQRHVASGLALRDCARHEPRPPTYNLLHTELIHRAWRRPSSTRARCFRAANTFACPFERHSTRRSVSPACLSSRPVLSPAAASLHRVSVCLSPPSFLSWSMFP